MTDLQRALYQFAQETRIPSLVRGEEKELRDNQKMVRAARLLASTRPSSSTRISSSAMQSRITLTLSRPSVMDWM